MKAFYATRYGGPEVMSYGDLPDPSPGRGEVLVAVRASSVNPVDWKLRAGEMRLVTGGRFPKVFGFDVAGVVAALGPGASHLAVGDRVYGMVPVWMRRDGAHAERVAVAARRLRPIPEGWTFEVAASLPVAALTALNGLRQCGELAGRSVLVNGATGGVGHFAVQIAAVRGAKVTAVCSARNAARARDLGAVEVLDYAAADFTRLERRWDVLFDAHGHLPSGAAARAVARGGAYLSTLGTPGVMLPALVRRLLGGPRFVAVNVRARPEDYAELETLVSSGRVRAIAEAVFPLERAAEAFAALERGGTPGKIVIRVGA